MGIQMSDYTPDKWLVVKLTNKQDEAHYRVFACWHGGYLGSDTWQFNSGIVDVCLVDDFYEFSGSSGSLYHCHKDGYGASGYGHSVLNKLIKDAVELTIEIMPKETDFLKLEIV